VNPATLALAAAVGWAAVFASLVGLVVFVRRLAAAGQQTPSSRGSGDLAAPCCCEPRRPYDRQDDGALDFEELERDLRMIARFRG